MSIQWRCKLGLWVCVLVAFGNAGCSKQSRVNRLLARANGDCEAERFERAEIEYRKVLTIAPQNPLALGRLGTLYYQQGRLPQAYGLLQQAVTASPEDVELRSRLCMVEFYAGRVKEAGEDARRVLAKQPGQADAISVLVDCAVSTNQVQALRQELEKWRQASGDRPAYHLALANFLIREGASTNAETEVKKALELDPKSNAAQAVLGTIYLARRDLPHAEAALRAAADLSPVRSPRRLDYADLKFRTGDPAKARELLEDITKKAPDYLPAWNYLARLAFAEQKHDECARYIQRVLALDPVNYDASSLDAILKMVKGQGADAIAELERLAQTYSGVKEVQYELGLAYLASGNSPKGVGCLEQALGLDPNYADAALALAKINQQRGNYDAVILSMTRLLNRQPQIVQAHFQLAEAYLAQGNIQDGVAVYQRMMVMFPKSFQVPYALAAVLVRQSQWQDQQGQAQLAQSTRQAARKSAGDALALAPDFVPALELLVDLDLAEHQNSAALARVQKESTRRPKEAELQVLLAKVYQAQGDSKQAEATLLKAIDMAPGLRLAYERLAQAYLADKKPQEALKELAGFISRTNDIVVLAEMAAIQEGQLKDYPAARDNYEKVLAINPKVGPVLNNLAYLYAQRLGQFDKALPLAQRARELSPADPGSADTLGWILFSKPQPDVSKALALLEEAAAKLPKTPEVQLHVGLARYTQGQESGARSALEFAARAPDAFPGKEQAQARLDILAIDPQNPQPPDRPKLLQRLEQDPQDRVAAVRLAALYSRDGETSKAASLYEQVLKLDPKNALVLRTLAELNAGPLKNLQKAVDYAKDAHAAAPDNPAIAQLLGHLVLQTNDFKWANSLLQEASRNMDPQPALLYDLAWSFYGLGRVPEAEAQMQKIISAGGQSGQVEAARQFLSLTGAYRDASLRPAASAQLDQFLKQKPDYIPAIMLSATMFQDKGSFQEAKQAFRKVLALDPLFTPAARDLTLLCFQHFPDETGLYEVALQAREAFPEDPRLAKALGILSFRREDLPRARQMLLQATQALPEDGEALCYLGLTLHRLNQNAASTPVLTRALTLKPDPKLTQLANQALEEIKKAGTKL